jgi:hypothetical protein
MLPAMGRSARRVVVVVVFAAVAAYAPVLAQWPRGLGPVPRTAAGEPDPNAPPPRTSEGKPDLSGVWRGITAPPGRRLAPSSSDPPIAVYREVGQNLPDGLPVTPYGLARLNERIAGASAHNPEAHCLPMGVMQLHTQGAPRKFVQTPSLLVILYEAGGETRQIFTDGRPIPPGDPQPWWNGYSVGRWEGDDLVVTTTHFRDGGWLDLIGSPLTDAATVTERFRRPTFARMDIDVTVEDRKAYTRPFTVRLFQELMPGGELIEFVCRENQRFKAPGPLR